MMAMTTSSSTSVNAWRRLAARSEERACIRKTPERGTGRNKAPRGAAPEGGNHFSNFYWEANVFLGRGSSFSERHRGRGLPRLRRGSLQRIRKSLLDGFG